MTITVAPFADYTGVAAGSGVTKVSVNAALDNFLALIPDTEATATDHSGAASAPSPEFGAIKPSTRDLLRAEIVALQAEIIGA